MHRAAPEDDVDSHLQKNTADSFSLAKNKVLTLNDFSLLFYLFYTTTLRPPESFESLSSMTEIVYLAVMFLALLNNHQYYIQSLQTERPKESLSLFS